MDFADFLSIVLIKILLFKLIKIRSFVESYTVCGKAKIFQKTFSSLKKTINIQEKS